MINTLLIDRETRCVTALTDQLNMYCPRVEICGVAYTREEACLLLQASNPELVFLAMDIACGTESNIFEQAACEFETILLYSGQKPAAEPLHIGAYAHLFKPVRPSALIEAVDRIRQRIHWKRTQQEIRKLLSGFINQVPLPKLPSIPDSTTRYTSQEFSKKNSA